MSHKKSMKRLRPCRRAAVSVLSVVVVGLSASPAGAHAIVKGTEPRIDETVEGSPERVMMEFNEPVEIQFGAIRVFDTAGERVDEGSADYVGGRSDAVAVGLEPELPDGTYTVTWRVISADSHPIEEAFVFHVGAPGSRPEGIASQILGGEIGAGPIPGVLLGIGRWLGFIGLLLMAGAGIFLVGVWRPSMPGDDADDSFLRRWRKVVVGGWIIVTVATLASIVLQGAVAADVPIGRAFSGETLRGVASTRFGKVMLARLVILGLAAGFWVVAARHLRPAAARTVGAAGRRKLPVWLVATGAVVALALLATPGLAGHAGTTAPAALSLSADAIHLAAGAAWVGGLIVLVLVAFPALNVLGDDARVGSAAAVVSRFSNLAMVAVAAIVATGVYASWLQVNALRALTGAPYGLVLLGKVAVFIPLLALGAINNRWTKPRIQKAAEQGESASEPFRLLRRLVGVEVALAIVVLAVTALLVNLPPAKVAAGVVGPFMTEATIGDHDAEVLVDPNEVGDNEVHVMFQMHGDDADDIRQVRVLFRMSDEGIGPLPADAKELMHGHWVVQGHQLSVAGEWSLEIVVRTGRFDEDRATVSVIVNR